MTRTFDRIAFNKDDEIIEQEIEEDAEDLAETESKIDVKIISQESETDETEVEELDKPWDRELDATNTISPVKRLEKNIKNQVFNRGIK